MASFSFRKIKGRYYARISEKGRDPRRKSWPLETTQKMTAVKRLNRLKKAFDRGDWDPWEGGWISPEPTPLQESIDEFLSDKSHLRPRTKDTYAGILRRFREQMPPGAMLQDVELDDLKQYIRAPDITSATQHKRFRHLRTKGNSERRVPIRGDAEKALVQMHEPGISGPVFTDRDGEPIRPGRVTTRFKDMAREADLDERIHFHSPRHTTGSWLSMQGVPLRHIQTILGHSVRSVTERYSHLAPETLDRAMEETFGGGDEGNG